MKHHRYLTRWTTAVWILAVLTLAITTNTDLASAASDSAEAEAPAKASAPKAEKPKEEAPKDAATAAAEKARRDRLVEEYTKTAYTTTMVNAFMGIPTWQNPNDVWITLEILWQVKPDFVVETGTHRGGSSALWATFLGQINPDARVITVDIEDRAADARKLPIVQEKVDMLVGSSTDPAIVARIREMVGDGRVLVILDSDHSRDHVLKELDLYGPMVEPGSYLIVQDTAANGHPLLPDYGPGPWEALDIFLPKNPQFVSDRSRERMLYTFHPRGYLKRVK